MTGRAFGVLLSVAGCAAVLAALVLHARPDAPVTQSHAPRPTAAVPVRQIALPPIKTERPRLPAPRPQDLDLLRQKNAFFVKQTLALGTKPDFRIDHAVMAETLAPGSVSLDTLHARLLAEPFVYRGNDQVWPLAVAYDQFHARWTPAQRKQLHAKLLEGCRYLIAFIERNQLSPYNVYLYNAPFQALVACALSAHGDHPDADAITRYAWHYWKTRVVPVWNQVMGKHGGWHEGKEYLGIGVGDAFYTVPALWQSATGIDAFADVPGLAGMPNFLSLRVRPDGEVFRLGDGSYFKVQVPDQRALAMKFDHPAAFRGDPHAQRIVPLASPWGPIPDSGWTHPERRIAPPLAGWFDGIGVLIARSSPDPDASYVWFKAGDNYWSHTQLDVGHFDIYKGGALALDSGFNYGATGYGGDHHMNYAYQSIAHNVVTVTDPADTTPMPGSPPRRIANDGGQRRIGSGWGQGAPVSLEAWLARRDEFETATVLEQMQRDDVHLVSADLTAAFTNRLSGKGTFAHRTRRVEQWFRSFGYDARDEVVVIYDHVRATRPAFRKRWLLHTQNRPQLDADTFEVRVAPGTVPGRAGGQLTGRVLWPLRPELALVGGTGREFTVDGRNYDDNGKLAVSRAAEFRRGEHTEPGSWRIELSPSTPARDDDFLVVMLPRLASAAPAPHRIRRLDSPTGPAVEITGPTRTTRWWFDRNSGKARFEVVSPP